MRQFLVSACYVLTAMLILSSMNSCNREANRQVAPQLQGLFDQLSNACNSTKIYSKKVIDLNDSQEEVQDSTFQLSAYAQEPLTCPLSSDLYYAYSQYFDQEGLAEYFDSRTDGDTLIGEIKPEYRSSIELQYQKIIRDGDRVLYFESFSSKANWLYELDMHIQLFFDEKGEYKHHSLDIYNAVPLLKENFKSRIEGKIQ